MINFLGMKVRCIEWFWCILNALQGCGFSWVKTPGSPAGGYLQSWEGTCPYPLLRDWSAKSCIKAGICGCNKRNLPGPDLAYLTQAEREAAAEQEERPEIGFGLSPGGR